MSFGWYLPQEITKDQGHSFYYEELPKIFDLISALYGNDKELRNALREFSDYYEKSEESLRDGIYWAKRIEDNHISITANLEAVKTGMILVNSNTVFEELILKSHMEKYKNSVITDNLKISSSSIEQLKKLMYLMLNMVDSILYYRDI
ncbi:hypothetical protein [Clostridium sp.]|jgi:hypothetical protein|uniref:hypothetical protein n=1 Tax=Clostridium sp. TaxID=1506 RepID=UPI0025869905|nr:hypothetical protein [Clostridium sp.]MDF2505834.1 hypothetical protein [Clostridium sp.]